MPMPTDHRGRELEGVNGGDPDADWSEHRMYVLGSLDRVERGLDKVLARIEGVDKQVAILSTKVLVIGGAAAVVVTALVEIFTRVIVGH